MRFRDIDQLNKAVKASISKAAANAEPMVIAAHALDVLGVSMRTLLYIANNPQAVGAHAEEWRASPAVKDELDRWNAAGRAATNKALGIDSPPAADL